MSEVTGLGAATHRTLRDASPAARLLRDQEGGRQLSVLRFFGVKKVAVDCRCCGSSGSKKVGDILIPVCKAREGRGHILIPEADARNERGSRGVR